MSLSCLSSLFLYSNKSKTAFLDTEAGCVRAKQKNFLNAPCVFISPLSKMTRFLDCFSSLSHHKAPGSKRMVAKNIGEMGFSILECACVPTLPLVQSQFQRLFVSASAETDPDPTQGRSVRCLGRATTVALKEVHKGQCPQIYAIASI